MTSAWRPSAFLAMLVLVLISSLSFAASEPGRGPERADMSVAYPQPSGVYTPLWVTYEAGLFKKYGLNVKLQLLSPQATVQAVISGSVDLAATADLLNARLQGAPVKLFGSTVDHYVFQMWGAKEITDIQKLKGRTIAVSTPRAPIDNASREVLKKNRLIPDKDVAFLYVQTVPAILTSVVGGNAAAGTVSAPTTLKAREAGLNLLADIGKLNIPGLQSPYGTTEKYLKENPNNIYAFLKAIAEGVVLTRSDPGTAKRAIANYTKVEDPKVIDETYEAFAPFWAMSLAVKPEAIQTQFGYTDEKDFPQVKNANPRDFFDNSFVDALEKSGFFQKAGFLR